MAKKGTKHPKTLTGDQAGKTSARGDILPSEPPVRPARGNAAAERWLQDQIGRLYQEVINEPLPKEFMDLIDKYRRKSAKSDPDGSLKACPNDGIGDA